MRLAGDSQRFVNRLEQTVAFAPHMRDIHPPRRRGNLRELHELIGLRKHARDVDERRRQAHGPFVHGSADVGTHPV